MEKNILVEGFGWMSYRKAWVDELLLRQIQRKLLRWFQDHKRDLPWRKTKDPYAIWVSEVMLQQTQVSTVIPYYKKFLKSFPTLPHLARASLSRVLKVWEGLGYYSRARHLHRASQLVLSRFDGRIPDTLEDLLSLPGIGRSTAGAILSFAFEKEAPILDGNAKRVLSRLFAISRAPKGTEALLWKTSRSLIPRGRAGSFNEAIMDLGATICTPKDPLCDRCPLRDLCRAWAFGKPETFPLKIKKKKIPHIQAISAVIEKDGKVLLRQRPPKGLLGGLWEFPNWPLEREEDLVKQLRQKVKSDLGLRVKWKGPFGTFNQTYSHFRLTLHVFRCEHLKGIGKGQWVAIINLRLFPMSKIARRISENLLH